MTPHQIALVKSSFQSVVPIADQAGEIFYDRLFALDPTVRPLFSGDMAAQIKKLMQALSLVVAGLDRLDTILPTVEALAARHVGYRVEDRHYETVGAALIWTLEKGLGASFTSEVRDAWIAAYELLAGAMVAAAARARAA
jgi:hemoglobin-like flavoprotein